MSSVKENANDEINSHDDNDSEWIGPMLSEASKSKRRKGKNAQLFLYILFWHWFNKCNTKYK